MTQRLTPDDLLDTLEYAALELGRPSASVRNRQAAAEKVDAVARRLRAQLKRPVRSFDDVYESGDWMTPEEMGGDEEAA